MAYADYPQLSATVVAEQDRRFYSVEHEDPTIGSDFEGGYRATRPGHLRTRYRRIFTTGWSDLTDAQKTSLEAFYRLVNGGASIWVWQNPFENYVNPFGQNLGDTFVRFAGKPKFPEAGIGPTVLYECQITLEEV